MTPAAHTRVLLAEFKMLGVPFPQAWASAMRALPRRTPDYRDWKGILNWSRPAYRACYENSTWHVEHLEDNLTALVLNEGSSWEQDDAKRLAELVPA